MNLRKILSVFIGSVVLCVQQVHADNHAELEGDSEENLNRYSHSSAIVESDEGEKVWAIVPDLDTVVVFDTEGNKVLKEFKVGKDPRSIAISKNRDFVFVANSESNSVSRIDLFVEDENNFSAEVRTDIGLNGEIVTGAEPRALVIDQYGDYVYVANYSQDTISVISTLTNTVVSAFDLASSRCNVGDRNRKFMPAALSIDNYSNTLYVTRFLSYTKKEGVQRSDLGKEGVVCGLEISKNVGEIRLIEKDIIRLNPQNTGFKDKLNNDTFAFPNQLHSIVLRDGNAYLPNIAASPSGPQSFDTITQSFLNVVKLRKNKGKDLGALNLHLGGLDPEEGKDELYFSNPVAIDFDSYYGAGFAYVASAGSDVIVKLKVSEDGGIQFTEDANTTRYIDLNDPFDKSTQGFKAGKNPIGIVVSKFKPRAYVLNYISRNISVINLENDRVENVIQIGALPEPGSKEEILLVGAEMFFSSRGNFVADDIVFGSNVNRLSEKGRQNCASCHAGGFTDGVVWQFATGPRKTISVNGTFNPHDVSDQRIINASAIFDEVEDADFNTRLVSSKGNLSDPLPCVDTPPHDSGLDESIFDPDHGLILGDWNVFAFAPCVMNQFEFPNSGRAQPFVQLPGSDVLVKAHDALIDWQRFGVRTPNSALTRKELISYGLPTDGALKDRAIKKGRELFAQAGCDTCHSGGKWSTSTKDFISPPMASEIATESGVDGVNPFQFLHRFLKDINSFNLNVEGEGNYIQGYRPIGGVEVDGAGRLALGADHNGDGLGDGYNVYSILGAALSPPYYHNGACETLECVLADENHRNAANMADNDPLITRKSRRHLAEFLRSIDEDTEIFQAPYN